NAVLALKREGYGWKKVDIFDCLSTFGWKGFYKIVEKHWRVGLAEIHRSLSKGAFVRSLQRLVPEIEESDLLPGGAGVRAQACSKQGKLLDDFYFLDNQRVTHVLNAPSPAAT